MLAALTGDVILMMGMTDKKMLSVVGVLFWMGRLHIFLLEHL